MQIEVAMRSALSLAKRGLGRCSPNPSVGCLILDRSNNLIGMGRTSDNKMIKEKIDWAPDEDLETGIDKTYGWILGQIESGIEDV